MMGHSKRKASQPYSSSEEDGVEVLIPRVTKIKRTKRWRRIVEEETDTDGSTVPLGDASTDKENRQVGKRVRREDLLKSNSKPVNVNGNRKLSAKNNAVMQNDDVVYRTWRDNEASSSSSKDDDDDVDISKRSRPRAGNSSTDDDDDESTDHSSVEDEDEETSSEFEKERQRVNSFIPPDRYLSMLEAEKSKGSSKRNIPSRRKINPKKLRYERNRVQDSDSEDDEDFNDVQEVSIHQIKMNHHKFQKFLEQANPEEKIIADIIAQHNEQNNKNEAPIYEEREVETFPKMVEADKNLFKNEGDFEPFRIKIYAQVIPRRPALMRAYGVRNVSTQFCHSLIFHYRKGEIFVLTTGQAWNVVQWCSDFGFPGKVAARILSRKGALKVTRKGLIGTDFMSQRTHNQVQESNPFDLLTFCTGYTTLIEENASILKLQCFKGQRPTTENSPDSDEDSEDDALSTSKTPLKPGKTTKVTVSQSGVRFLKRFRPSDFLAILNHLSLIAQNRRTSTLDGEVETDSSAHVQYLSPVQIEVGRELDLELSKQLHTAIADETGMIQLQNYSFAHKHFTDFFYGTDFFLKYGRSAVHHWKNCPPTVTQVIQALRKVDQLADVDYGTTDDDYKKILDRCKITYSTTTARRNGNKQRAQKPEKVLNFIQGMCYRRSDNNVYWHVQGSWCNLQPSYIILIQKEVLTLIQQHLRESSHLGLKYSWSLSKDGSDGSEVETDTDENDNLTFDPHAGVKEYLSQYRNLRDYYVSPTPGEDIVDMIKIKKTKGAGGSVEESFTLFYILSSISHHCLTQGVRVTNCLTQLRKGEALDTCGLRSTSRSTRHQKLVGGSEHNLASLKKLYNQIRVKTEFLRVTPNFSEFRKLLSNATIVLGIGGDGSIPPTRTLEEEKDVLTSIEPRNIEEQLEAIWDSGKPSLKRMLRRLARKLKCASDPLDYSRMATTLHRLMVRNDLIGGDNSITSKLVALSPSTVPIPELKDLSYFIYENIIKAFQPPASTFLGKMELIRIRRNVLKLGIQRFFIAEIPLEED